jgi:hypothetical protein
MATIPSPKEVFITIEAIFTIPTTSLSLGDNIVQSLSNISKDNALTIASNGGQAVATVVSAAVLAGLIAPGGAIVIGTTAIVATIAIAKNLDNILDPNSADRNLSLSNQRGQPRILFNATKTKSCHVAHALN